MRSTEGTYYRTRKYTFFLTHPCIIQPGKFTGWSSEGVKQLAFPFLISCSPGTKKMEGVGGSGVVGGGSWVALLSCVSLIIYLFIYFYFCFSVSICNSVYCQKSNNTNAKTHGLRTFSCFGPHFWNSLPQDLRHCSTLVEMGAGGGEEGGGRGAVSQCYLYLLLVPGKSYKPRCNRSGMLSLVTCAVLNLSTAGFQPGESELITTGVKVRLKKITVTG